MSTFSFAAHSSMSALEATLALGTQWSHKPIDSLPAACAVLTKGVVMTVADAAAVVETKRRREIYALLTAFLPYRFLLVQPSCDPPTESGPLHRGQAAYREFPCPALHFFEEI